MFSYIDPESFDALFPLTADEPASDIFSKLHRSRQNTKGKPTLCLADMLSSGLLPVSWRQSRPY